MSAAKAAALFGGCGLILSLSFLQVFVVPALFPFGCGFQLVKSAAKCRVSNFSRARSRAKR
jgi:hypothetical protein